MEQPDERPEMRAIPALPEKFSEGRDELNFAEFPLGTIAERNQRAADRRVFWADSKSRGWSRNSGVGDARVAHRYVAGADHRLLSNEFLGSGWTRGFPAVRVV